MNCGERLVTDLTHAAPVMQFTPGQALFRKTLGEGRWQSDIDFGQHPGQAALVRSHPDGTVQLRMMGADEDGWVDMPGSPCHTVVAGRV
jgi:hypothetical protein